MAVPSGKSSSDSTPIVAGVVAAVGGAALIALVVFRVRRRVKRKTAQPPPSPPSHDHGNLEEDSEAPQTAQPPSYWTVLGGDQSRSHQDTASHHRHTAAEAAGVEDEHIGRSSASAAPAGLVQSSTERATGVAGGAGVAGKDTDFSAELLPATASVATSSTAGVSTDTKVELAEFRQNQSAADAASIAGGPQSDQASGGGEAPSAADRNKPAGDIGLGHAVLAAAQELAHHCQVPGISEAAAALCTMANLVKDSRENDRASDSRLRQCRSIVAVLQRASKVVGKVSGHGVDRFFGRRWCGKGAQLLLYPAWTCSYMHSSERRFVFHESARAQTQSPGDLFHGIQTWDTTEEATRVLVEDVHDAIFDLAELIKTFQSKNKLSKLFLSTLFKRRQDELVAVVDRAIMRLQVSGIPCYLGAAKGIC